MTLVKNEFSSVPSAKPAPETAGSAPTAGGAELAAPVRTVSLVSGRSLEVSEHGREERIQVRSPEGQVLLSLRLTDEGPVLSLSGVSLEIAADKRLTLACDTLCIQAAGDASIDVGGSLRERVEGSAIREVGKASVERAREVKVEASPGGVVIEGNDDVNIRGERVRLNSEDPPMPLTWEEHRERQARRLTGQGEPAALAPSGPGFPRLPDR